VNAKLNGPTKVAGIIVAAGATAVGSSYVTVLTATPSRAEVSGLVGAAVAAVKETQGLDRTTMLEWRAMQQENFEGLRADVQKLCADVLAFAASPDGHQRKCPWDNRLWHNQNPCPS